MAFADAVRLSLRPAPRPARRLDALALNSMAVAASVIVASLFGFVFWVLAARWFSPAAVGPVSALFGLIGLGSSLATCGLPETMVRFLRTTEDQRGLLRRAVSVTMFAGAVIGTGLAVFWQRSDEALPLTTVAVIVVAAVSVIASATTNVADNAVVTLGSPTLLIVESTAAGISKIGLLAVAAATGAGAGGIAVALAGAAAIGGSTIAVCIGRFVPLRRSAAVGAARRAPILGAHRGYSIVNWLGGAASMVPTAVAGTIAVARIGPDAAAFIGIPLLMFGAMNIVPASAARSLFAEASRTPERLAPLTRRTLALGAALLAPVAAVVAVAAPILLSVFGPEYVDNSVGALRWLCAASFVGVLNYVGDVVLNVRVDRAEYLVANVLGSFAVLLGALLGSAHGVRGIGLGWVAGQLAYAAVVWSLVAWRPFARREPHDA